MAGKTLLEEQRENEILHFQRDMFWRESGKQKLIKTLLLKIYDLEDKVKELSK